MYLRVRTKRPTKKQLLKELRNTIDNIAQVLLYNFDNVYLVDYTSMSVLPLKANRSRFLRNSKGYYKYGFVVAFNPKTNRKYYLKTTKTQLVRKDILRLKRNLGNVILFCDKQHNLKDTYRVSKKLTQLVEVQLSFKKSIYECIKAKQKLVKGQIFTDIEFQQLKSLYEDTMENLGWRSLS